MPLIVDPESWTVDRLREQLRVFERENSQMVAALSRGPPSIPNPHAIAVASSVAQQAGELAKSILEQTEIVKPIATAAVNLIYESTNAMGYLMRAAGSPPPPLPSPTKEQG